VNAAPRVPCWAPWEQRGGPSEEEQSRSPRITPVGVEGWSPLLKREVRNVGFLKSFAQLISKSLGSRREHRSIDSLEVTDVAHHGSTVVPPLSNHD